ncbi:MAG TPA: hypothetical protein VGE27_09980 [Gemmatimonas sp.]|uniref:hypothetical protein n=1 Tax=Gemmatimonas sp. TaxID=1962908 RepID=UPI002ED927AB
MQGRGAGAGADTVIAPASVRLRAGARLVLVALLTIGAGCGVFGRGGSSTPKPAPTQTPTPTPPGAVVAPPRPDSAPPSVPVRPDSTPRPTPPTDSAARADSLANAVVSPEEAARIKAIRDSTARVDSIARVAEARKKARPASRPCVMDFSESPPETRLLYSRVTDSISNTFIGGGFVGHCQGENNRIRADSAEQFQAPGIVNLYGNVMYEEPGKMQIRASHATYFTREGRLYADGNVTATQLATGSSFSGPAIEYYRAMPDRPVSRMIAPTRSTARLIEKDSLGRMSTPTVIVANRFEDAGDSLLMAWGDVIIDRDKLNGKSDSSSFDKLKETARLVRGARITNRDTAQSFVLVGDTIDMYSTNRQLNRVVALHKGSATNDDMVLDAERIDLRLEEQLLKDAYAFGPGRAKAKTPQQDVEADSLRIRLEEKRVREVHAVGGAVAIGTPDSLRIKTTEKDVLRGDKVFAYFDSTPRVGADTLRKTQISEIRALGNASSLFHMANSRGREAPPGINYVRGARIFVNFDTGSVRTVRVDSAASGLYLEPEPDSLSDSTRKADSTRRAPTRGRPPGTPPDTVAPVSPANPAAPPGKRDRAPTVSLSFLPQQRFTALQRRP